MTKRFTLVLSLIGVLVLVRFNGGVKAWEEQMEWVLIIPPTRSGIVLQNCVFSLEREKLGNEIDSRNKTTVQRQPITGPSKDLMKRNNYVERFATRHWCNREDFTKYNTSGKKQIMYGTRLKLDSIGGDGFIPLPTRFWGKTYIVCTGNSFDRAVHFATMINAYTLHIRVDVVLSPESDLSYIDIDGPARRSQTITVLGKGLRSVTNNGYPLDGIRMSSPHHFGVLAGHVRRDSRFKLKERDSFTAVDMFPPTCLFAQEYFVPFVFGLHKRVNVQIQSVKEGRADITLTYTLDRQPDNVTKLTSKLLLGMRKHIVFFEPGIYHIQASGRVMVAQAILCCDPSFQSESALAVIPPRNEWTSSLTIFPLPITSYEIIRSIVVGVVPSYQKYGMRVHNRATEEDWTSFVMKTEHSTASYLQFHFEMSQNDIFEIWHDVDRTFQILQYGVKESGDFVYAFSAAMKMTGCGISGATNTKFTPRRNLKQKSGEPKKEQERYLRGTIPGNHPNDTRWPSGNPRGFIPKSRTKAENKSENSEDDYLLLYVLLFVFICMGLVVPCIAVFAKINKNEDSTPEVKPEDDHDLDNQGREEEEKRESVVTDDSDVLESSVDG